VNAEPSNLEWVMRMRLLIPGVSPDEAIELARAVAAQGRVLEAAAELEERAQLAPDLAKEFLPAARAMRAQLN
jgi:hypothetical protein